MRTIQKKSVNANKEVEVVTAEANCDKDSKLSKDIDAALQSIDDIAPKIPGQNYDSVLEEEVSANQEIIEEEILVFGHLLMTSLKYSSSHKQPFILEPLLLIKLGRC